MIDLLENFIESYKEDWQRTITQRIKAKNRVVEIFGRVKPKANPFSKQEHMVLEFLDLYTNGDQQPFFTRFSQFKSFNLSLRSLKLLKNVEENIITYDSTIDDDEVSDSGSYLYYTTIKDQLDNVCEELVKFRDSSSSYYGDDLEEQLYENPYHEEYTYI